MFPSFEFLGRTIGMYGVCAVIGLLTAGFVCAWLAKKRSITADDIILVLVCVGVGMFIGGHLLFGITNIKKIVYILSHTYKYDLGTVMKLLYVQISGMVFYGGMLGGILGIYLFCRPSSKRPLLGDYLDIYSVGIPLFHVFGRIGCFFGGCCYGRESSWGIVVHGNTVVPEVNDVVRIPTALIESGCNLFIFFIMMYAYLRVTKNNGSNYRGRLLLVYFLIYPPVRFVIEFFRGDAIRGIWWGLSTSQWISIVLFSVGIIGLLKSKREKKQEQSAEARK